MEYDTTYKIKVKVKDAAGNEAESEEKEVKTPAKPAPTTDTLAPTITKVEAQANETENKILVRATAEDAAETEDSLSTGIAGYAFSKDDGTTWTDWQESAEYLFEDLEYDTTYKIKVKVKDNAGNEAESEEYQVKTVAENNSYDVKIGDVTGDNMINARDKLAVARHIAIMYDPVLKERYGDKWELKGDNLKAADVDENGIINAVDKLRIARYIAVNIDDVLARNTSKLENI